MFVGFKKKKRKKKRKKEKRKKDKVNVILDIKVYSKFNADSISRLGRS